MQVYRDPYTKLNTPTVIALGCFDGVHTAHAAVIREAVGIARELGALACVWCFAEPPRNTFAKTPVPLITSLGEKTALIAALGAEILVCPDFTREIARVSARDFVCGILSECAGAVHLVSGRNYSFGSGGEGDSAMLAALCEELGIGYTAVSDVSVDGVGVSSTEIRRAAAEGRCAAASRLLGRAFSVEFTLTDGRYVSDASRLAPADGEYLARIGGTPVRVRITRADSIPVLELDTAVSEPRLRVEFDSDRI